METNKELTMQNKSPLPWEYELAYSALTNILKGDNVLSGNAVDSTDGTLYPDVKEGIELAIKLILRSASERSND